MNSKSESPNTVSGIVSPMLEQLNSGDNNSIANALFVLRQEEELPSDAYEQIASFLKDSDDNIRNSALKILMQAPSLTDELKIEIGKFIGDSDVNVQRAVAAYIFENISAADVKIQKRVHKAIAKSTDDDFKIISLQILMKWNPPTSETIELFLGALKGESYQEMRHIINYFVEFPDYANGEVSNSLFKLLQTYDCPVIKMISANALSGIKHGSKEIEKYVQRFLEDAVNMEKYLDRL